MDSIDKKVTDILTCSLSVDVINNLVSLLKDEVIKARIDEIELNMGYFDTEDRDILKDRIKELQSKLGENRG